MCLIYRNPYFFWLYIFWKIVRKLKVNIVDLQTFAIDRVLCKPPPMLSDSNHNCCIVPGSTQAGRDPKMGTTSVWKGINYKRLNQPLEYGRRRGLKTTHFFQFSERKMFSKGRYRRSEVKGHKHFTFMFVLLLLLRLQPKKVILFLKIFYFGSVFMSFCPFRWCLQLTSMCPEPVGV